MTNAGDACGFLDDHEEFVYVDDADIGSLDRLRKRLVPEFDDILGGYFSNRVQAEVAVDLDFSTPNRVSDIPPAPVGQSLFDCPFESGSLVGIV